jgi:hypothetical protein
MMGMEQRRSAVTVLVAIVVVVALVLYPLSAGPAYNIVRSGLISEQQYETFYWPVLRLVRAYRPFDELARSYRDFWATD